MQRRTRVLIAVVVGAPVGFLAFVFVAIRTRSPRMLRLVRRFNRAFTNRVQRRFAGTPGAAASLIRHEGRRSRRAYATPIGAFEIEDGFVVTLPYGSTADWVQNVMAAGSAVLVHEGRTVPVDRPELIRVAEARDWFPASEQRIHRLFRIEHGLRLHRAPTRDGAPQGI
ncbi:PNPOx family protein [Actinomarinicola tropica]|uniref:Nitroreductase family deazaflavin-dependent oxidoreductase n=1 Tax=Actinomarinicola tropica TaxID=2789776 RepID=A0A5Q2RK20_9ACTN|nr:nitroreductase family deazaflavin-dependent oxidoreductase [Actinomarinicola tropica]QGG94200.1 nitroreductase family deazaflavin-dependent oxidoreductase [Actinomarinicola tropica]